MKFCKKIVLNKKLCALKNCNNFFGFIIFIVKYYTRPVIS